MQVLRDKIEGLQHAHFDICHYLMILYHFDQMNDKMIFFFLLNQCFCHCNASRLVAPDYVQFMHPLVVLIVHDWLWLCKSFVKTFKL